MVSQYTKQLVASREWTDEWDCKKFAGEFKFMADKEGHKSFLLGILYKDDSAHQQIYYEDNGIYFYNPQTIENKIIDFADVEFIELEKSFKGFYTFWFNGTIWEPVIVNGKDKCLF